MDTETLTPPVTPETAPVVETPEPTEESVSIADHAEQFQPESKRPVSPEVQEARRQAAATQRRDDVGRFDEGRHRAKSQRAGAEDVQTINELTKELRTAEAELLKAKPDALGNDSPRVRALRLQVKAMKAELGEVTRPASAAPATAPAAQARLQSTSEPVKAGGELGKEPELDDFLDKPDPYAEWTKAWNRWDRKREASEATQQASIAARDASDREKLTKHEQRLTKFAASTPDFSAKTSPLMTEDLPWPLIRAIVEDDNGPAFMYHLAQHPAVKDDMVLMTYRQDATDDVFVASVQRRLAQHVAAVKTGSAPVPRTYTPPKPPNPVRTGSVQTSDEPPGEGASIADHARYYGPQARR